MTLKTDMTIKKAKVGDTIKIVSDEFPFGKYKIGDKFEVSKVDDKGVYVWLDAINDYKYIYHREYKILEKKKKPIANLGSIEIRRDYSIRPNNNDMSNVWYVEEGERYDLVRFTIKEINGYYWNEGIAVPCGTDEEEINQLVEDFIKDISAIDVADFKRFIEFGNEWGWD